MLLLLNRVRTLASVTNIDHSRATVSVALLQEPSVEDAEDYDLSGAHGTQMLVETCINYYRCEGALMRPKRGFYLVKLPQV